VLALGVADDRAVFMHLPADDPVGRAGVSVREADVLVLLLAGLTTAAIAARLRISPATSRSHCRAVLRKLGAADRTALRAGFAGAPRLAAGDPGAGGAPRFAQPSPRALPRNRP
jgi:DNA-binding CsgD family transcriptional regulator